MTSDPSWKSKYLQELEASEQREARWEEEKNLLERMLVRTSLASEGQSRDLDRLLKQVREEVRKDRFNAAAWHSLQDRIDQNVALLDDRKEASDKALADTFGKLVSALKDCAAFHAAKDRLKELEKQLRKSGKADFSFDRWMMDFASALQVALARFDVNPPAETAESGILRKWFGRGNGAEGHSEPSAQSSDSVAREACHTPSQAPVMELAGDEAANEESDQRMRIARRVGELLGHMLEQVVLEPAAEARARRLQDRLLVGSDWDELREGLNGVAELVISAVTRSQREFEDFLRRLDERLETLRKYFAEQEDAQAGRLGASEELDQEIRRELDSFGQKVDQSEDFQQLKNSVSGHLQSIRDAVGRFRTKESEREKHLAHQLATMQERMAAMEAQADQVKGELREQRHRAMTDVLTQLPNREAWQERLDLEYQRWRRYGSDLTLAVLDIDLFKRVNDSYGHKAGDRVLQLVAKALRDRLRQTDFIARFGGEEFVLLFTATGVEAAREVLDGLRAHIKNLPFHFRGDPVSVSFSAGVAGFSEGDEPDEVFDRADRSLYQAKELGRDQVCPAGGSDTVD